MGRPARNAVEAFPCFLCFPKTVHYGQQAKREHMRVAHQMKPGWKNYGRVVRRGKLRSKPV